MKAVIHARRPHQEMSNEMSTAEKNATIEAENARLQARIDELEAELRSRSSQTRHTESAKLRNETLDKVSDEASRLVHAMSLAFVEDLRAVADVVKAVSDEAFKRRDERVAKDEDIKDMRLSDVENDVAAVLNKGIEKTIAAPRRAIDKFYEVYREGAAR
jgi:hypothetical protein